jgi:hypothetical protein
MRWKKYFGQFGGQYDNNREIQTYDNMQAEISGIYGMPILYYTLNIDDYKNSMDIVHGESATPKWDRVFKLTALNDNFTQEAQKFSSFGLENIDELSVYIHRSTFDRLIGGRSGLTPIKSPNLTARPSERGGFGPAPLDIIETVHNGLVYEVVQGGLHFLDSNAQHFGYKFWYKLTLKQRETSSPTIGIGENYGPRPANISLEEFAELKGLPRDYYLGNTQFVVKTPACEDLRSSYADTTLNMAISAGPLDSCGVISYTTMGMPQISGGIPSDALSEDGRTPEKYLMRGPRPQSNSGEGDEIQKEADQTIDPIQGIKVYSDSASGREIVLDGQGVVIYQDTGEPVPTNSDDYKNFIGYNKYGPTGRVIRHNRDLWGNW